MARDENKSIIDGRLCKDNRVFDTKNGGKIVKNTIAYNKSYKKGNEEVKETTFIPLKAFGEWAERLNEFKKGDLVHIEGELHQNNWTDKETGKPRSQLEIIVWDISSLAMASKKPDKPQGTPSTPHKDPVDGFVDDELNPPF